MYREIWDVAVFDIVMCVMMLITAELGMVLIKRDKTIGVLLMWCLPIMLITWIFKTPTLYQ